MRKLELLQLVKLHAPPPVYIIEEMAEALGHKVLRLPPRHPELNAIEMAWAYVKGYVAKRNTTGSEAMIKNLIGEACVSAKPVWGKIVEHTRRVEEEYWKREIACEDFVDEMVFGLDDSEDESDESDGEYGDESGVNDVENECDSENESENLGEDESMDEGENESMDEGEDESMDEGEDDGVCKACKESFPPSGNDAPKWVQCDLCEEWLHFECANVKSDSDANGVWRCESCIKIVSFNFYKQ
jgi:hypothetical protein